ncbi:MAG: nucleoside hydrolase [Bacteroidales bacterium]|nr:nucleoside hydrolase [Bacteroidales bacterium]
MKVNNRTGRLILAVSFLLMSLFAEAHSGKARFHIIIDTDGAADDLRAICMLLSNREVETLAITTSEGALQPADAALKVTSLLHHFHHEGIPAGAGRALNIRPPAWRRQSEQISWGDTANVAVSGQTAVDLIIRTLEGEEEKVIFVCLGTLTNLSDALVAKPQLKDRIERVIWYNSSAKPLKGSNYDADRLSADKALASGIRVDIVSGEDRQEILIDGAYVDMISRAEHSAYAEKIAETHSSGVLQPVVSSRHMKMWDDLTAVYLFAPELFTSTDISRDVSAHSPVNPDAGEKAREMAVQILQGKPDSESRVFYGFPEDPGLYAADVAPVVKDLISRHGRSEWRAGALANELHGHLGIYAIIGVKMGIRAREFFNIGVDDIAVVSYAGLQQPVSCMNDGLQVSTGGTLGHGLISVAAGEAVRPEASFTFKDKTLRLKLKPLYARQIRKDVEDAIRRYGSLTEPYWQQIRTLALKYWGEFDRHEIFEMEYGADH